MRARAAAVLLGLAGLATGCRSGGSRAEAAANPPSEGLRLDTAFTGLRSPVYLTAPPGDARVFIVEQVGIVRIAREARLLARPYLDLTDRVGSGGERGLLSLAFHPDFARNGRFFVDYTDRHGDTHVAEFHAEPGADTAEAASERQLLLVRQPYANHNGGHVLFGPDGKLYVGMGDGGSAGDPHGNAQDTSSRLGKILRIDVDAGTIEPWARGVRNPWRLAFDAGLLYIADVGQGRWEEVNVMPASVRGLNYGWRTMEGAHCYRNPVCARAGLVSPVLEYGHDEGCSIIGGLVYRGRDVPLLDGQYLYSDYCSGWLRSLRYADGAVQERHTWRIPPVGPVLSFGADGRGEAYLLAQSGTVYRIAAQ